jgi:hypothetical protein
MVGEWFHVGNSYRLDGRRLDTGTCGTLASKTEQHPMKFTIRDLFLLTLVVALALGWLVDHWRASAREAQWERAFEQSLQALSKLSQKDTDFDTPSGIWQIVPEHKDVNNKVVKPR